MIYEKIPSEQLLFFIFYGVTGVTPLIAALYLLFRQGNAIAAGVTSPVRLRRWTASFFAVASLAHVWWLLFYLYSGDLSSMAFMVLGMLDCVLLFATFAGMLLAMLQDRRRHVWPFLVAMIPFMVLWGVYMAWSRLLLGQIAVAYLVLLCLVFTGYMIFASRQYGRWLNDNYADLENKKVWLIQTASLVCMLLFVIYVLANDMLFIWIIHIIELVLVGLLLWRVETLPNLEAYLQPLSQESEQLETEDKEDWSASGYLDVDYISGLLHQHCVATKLYLQNDLTLLQLAQVIGTNRSYLSQYFSRQSITYNTYINNLRINYFISRYHEILASGHPVVAQLLASESGYRSYSTFSLAFKQRTGMSVTAWMHNTNGD